MKLKAKYWIIGSIFILVICAAIYSVTTKERHGYANDFSEITSKHVLYNIPYLKTKDLFFIEAYQTWWHTIIVFGVLDEDFYSFLEKNNIKYSDKNIEKRTMITYYRQPLPREIIRQYGIKVTSEDTFKVFCDADIESIHYLYFSVIATHYYIIIDDKTHRFVMSIYARP